MVIVKNVMGIDGDSMVHQSKTRIFSGKLAQKRLIDRTKNDFKRRYTFLRKKVVDGDLDERIQAGSFTQL